MRITHAIVALIVSGLLLACASKPDVIEVEPEFFRGDLRYVDVAPPEDQYELVGTYEAVCTSREEVERCKALYEMTARRRGCDTIVLTERTDAQDRTVIEASVFRLWPENRPE